LNNCIVYFNTDPDGGNCDASCVLNYCCTTPSNTSGTGNITNAPAFVDYANGNLRLQSNSPCINSGYNAYVTSQTDLEGNPRLVGSFVDMGAEEYQLVAPVPVFPSLQANYTQVSTGFTVDFTGQIGGHPNASRWDFGDGTVISNQLLNVSHDWALPGDYVVTLRAYNDNFPQGVSAALTIHIVSNLVQYVSTDSTNPVVPYTSWATAAKNIQQAVDSCVVGGLIWVSNGTYTTGGRVGPIGSVTNRVTVDKPLRLRSVNGPQWTFIDGVYSNRCLYLASGASLSGFTLMNGAADSGGGVWCESPTAVVSNCTLTANSAQGSGGGATGGTLINCTLTSNSVLSDGGGAAQSTLIHCAVTHNSANGNGGGASYSTLINCTLSGNSAPPVGPGGGGSSGGGAYESTLINCALAGNSAYAYGGGVYGSTLTNCTLTGNSAYYGGGAYGGSLNNCIVFFNTSFYAPQNYDSTILNYCCTTPSATNGVGNITNIPLFVDYPNGDLHLESSSPCINSGNNSFVTYATDLDGNPRIVRGTVDIGAYEYQGPGSEISYAWLQQYGLPTDGSADFADADHDGMSNWQEWIAGTDPTNALSVLRLLPPALNGANITLTWLSVPGVNYFLERSANLTEPTPLFTTITTDITGQPGRTAYTDTTAIGRGPFFYRVGVKSP
jgi:hypothetical protein